MDLLYWSLVSRWTTLGSLDDICYRYSKDSPVDGGNDDHGTSQSVSQNYIEPHVKIRTVSLKRFVRAVLDNKYNIPYKINAKGSLEPGCLFNRRLPGDSLGVSSPLPGNMIFVDARMPGFIGTVNTCSLDWIFFIPP